MSQNLTKKQLKTLKDSLGKQGLTLEDHEKAQETGGKCEILEVDCFSLKNSDSEKDADGWFVGYGVEYNGVGISAAQESSSDDERHPEHPEVAEESSGFSSDPPSDIDEDVARIPHRRSSDDVSDEGQLMYGVDETLYVDKSMIPVKSVLKTMENEEKTFETSDFITTKRFPIASSHQESDEDVHHGYQKIGQEPCSMNSENEEEEDVEVEELTKEEKYPMNSERSSGLWCNFVIPVPDYKGDSKEETARRDAIKLDSSKTAQISSIASGFSLPTPPGWEGVTDEKLLDFIRQRL